LGITLVVLKNEFQHAVRKQLLQIYKVITLVTSAIASRYQFKQKEMCCKWQLNIFRKKIYKKMIFNFAFLQELKVIAKS